MTPLFTIIGVTTTQSSIMPIFSQWRDMRGLCDDVKMASWDLLIHAPRALP